MRCTNCQANISFYSRLCPYCGTKPSRMLTAMPTILGLTTLAMLGVFAFKIFSR